MSKIKTSPEKKRLSYERDHYNRGGENNKAWRKTKPLKKATARRVFRKAANEAVREIDPIVSDAAAEPKKRQAIRQNPVEDWGSVNLHEFVATRSRASNASKPGRP